MARETKPLVLIGARTNTRGRELEKALSRDGRVVVVGVHLEGESLLSEVLATPDACLLLDSSLSDCTALDVLYRVMMKKPSPAVVLSSPLGGEFAVEAIRAGALDCLAWQDTRSIIDATAEALVRAAQTPLFPLRMDGALAQRSTRHRATPGAPSRNLVLLVGTRRAKLVCDAVDYLPPSFPASVLCRDVVHPSLSQAFGTKLSRRAELYVSMARRASIKKGTLHLAEVDASLVVRMNGEMAFEPRPSAQVEGVIGWLEALEEGLRREKVKVALIIGGYLKPGVARAARRVVEAGGALARTIPEGFQIRWPQVRQPLTLKTADFWAHLNQHIDADEEGV